MSILEKMTHSSLGGMSNIQQPNYQDNGIITNNQVVVNDVENNKDENRCDECRNVTNEKQKLIENLLVDVEKIDFVKYVKKLGGEIKTDRKGTPQTPKQKYIRKILVKYLKELSEKKEWKIITEEGDFIYLYNGSYWIPFNENEIIFLLEEFSIKTGVPEIEVDYEFKKRLYQELMTSLNLKTKKNIKDNQINLLNGTLKLDSMKLEPFDYREFLTYQLPYEYKPNEVNNLWLKFLDEVIPDKDTQKTLQEVIGSIFVKGVKLEYSTFLYGSGANGKSVVIEVIKEILGKENYSSFSIENLMNDYYRAEIKDKLVNFSSENDTRYIKSNLFKTLSSGEEVSAQHKYKNPFVMRNYAKIILAVNQMTFQNVEHTEGFFRRFLIIPFDVTIPKEKRDKTLIKKILNNGKSGILNWIITGSKNVLEKEDIFISKECKNALSKFIKNVDTVMQFLDECEYQKSSYNRLYLSNLYNQYRQFCDEAGIYYKVGRNEFSKRLETLKYEKLRDSKGYYFLLEKKQLIN